MRGLNTLSFILFIIVAIIGIISYKEYDNLFEFGPVFGISFVVSFIVLIFVEISSWDTVIVPAIIRGVPVYTEQVRAYVQGEAKWLTAILLTIEEPIIIGLLFPLIFEGIHIPIQHLYEYIDDIRQENFKDKYLDVCLNVVSNSKRPVYEKEVLDVISYYNKDKLKGKLLESLKQRTCFDAERNLYWGANAYIQMKSTIENTLLNTSPKPLEWLLNNIPKYAGKEYIAFKVTAIRELAAQRIFILEATTGSAVNSSGEETALYRHRNGSKIKRVVFEDDPDFY